MEEGRDVNVLRGGAILITQWHNRPIVGMAHALIILAITFRRALDMVLAWAQISNASRPCHINMLHQMHNLRAREL
eukprot:6014177-Lingulodinium_polyedra.AAC.1